MPEPSAPTPRPTAISASAVSAERERLHVVGRVDVAEDRGQRDLLAEEEQQHGGDRPDEAAQQPLEHERAADEPVRRADELHHLDLAAAREDREPDRVRDQDHRRDQQHDHHHEEDDPDPLADLEDALRRLLPVLDLLDARRTSGAEVGRDHLDVVRRSRGVTSNEAGSGFEGRFAVSCGYFFFIRFSASVFETNWYSLIRRRRCAR